MNKDHLGLPMLRSLAGGISARPPCTTCPKIPSEDPVKHYSHAIELSDRNLQAYQHYKECSAVGFTDEERADAIVRRNAAIIADEETVALEIIRNRATTRIESVMLAAMRLRNGGT